METRSDQPTLPEGGGEFAFLRNIAERATPLWDRSAIDEQAVSKQNIGNVRRRLKRWRKVLGHARILDKRLRNAGVSFAAEDLLRKTVRLSMLPSWVDILAAALAWQPTGHRQDATVDPAFDPSSPLPFQELLVGFIRVARDRLAAAPNSALEVLQPAAARDLERQLLTHLTFVASLAFGQNFYAFRFDRAPAAAIESAWNRPSTSTDIYRSYVQHIAAVFVHFSIFTQCSRAYSHGQSNSGLRRPPRFAAVFTMTFAPCKNSLTGPSLMRRTRLRRSAPACLTVITTVRPSPSACFARATALSTSLAPSSRRQLSTTLSMAELVEHAEHPIPASSYGRKLVTATLAKQPILN